MTEDEFAGYTAHSIAGYAESVKVSKQIGDAEARAFAEKQYSELLPQGIHTPGHHLFRIVLGQKPIGYLWYAAPTSERPAFLYDVEILGSYQGHGFGRQALRLFEDEARKLGATRVSLHVFGQNHRAMSLYESCGYEPTNVVMAKDL